MTRRLTAVLLAVALLIAVGIVVGAKAVVGDHNAPAHKTRHRHVVKIDALSEGYRFAALVNYTSWKLHKKMWLTPVHCAADSPTRFACSFQQTTPDVCRFIRWRYRADGNVEIVLAGLVPTTFCKGGKRVAVQ